MFTLDDKPFTEDIESRAKVNRETTTNYNEINTLKQMTETADTQNGVVESSTASEGMIISTPQNEMFTSNKNGHFDGESDLEDEGVLKTIIIACGVAAGPITCFLYIAIRACIESHRKVHPMTPKPKLQTNDNVQKKKPPLSVNLMDKYNVSSTSTSYTTISNACTT